MSLLENVHGYGATGSKPAAAAANEGYLYFDTTLGRMERSNGASWDVVEPATSGIPATLLDAKGDLIAASAADTAAKVTVGTNGALLTADSTAGAGVAWVGPVIPWAIIPYYGASAIENVSVGANNRAIYIPCIVQTACTITGLRLNITASSGNICVGLYSGTSRVATSGAVASPGTSFRDIAFTGSYAAAAGRYYLALSADNTTFSVTGNVTSGGGAASNRFEETAHPLPATATFNASPTGRQLAIIGLVSGGHP